MSGEVGGACIGENCSYAALSVPLFTRAGIMAAQAVKNKGCKCNPEEKDNPNPAL